MEHALLELAPGRLKELPATTAAQPEGEVTGRRDRGSRRAELVGRRPLRNRQQAAALRADARQLEWALARMTR